MLWRKYDYQGLQRVTSEVVPDPDKVPLAPQAANGPLLAPSTVYEYNAFGDLRFLVSRHVILRLRRKPIGFIARSGSLGQLPL